MSLNLQKELLEFQKELRELNTYSSEMKRMEKGLAEAEALTSAATKAAERISSKHREHLQETKKELNAYLNESTVASKQLIADFVKQFTHQIRLEVERIEPLVNTLESGTKTHLQEYDAVLKSLQDIVSSVGPKLEQHVEALQEQNSRGLWSLTSGMLTLHTKHTESVTELLQEKTSLLIKTGEVLQEQSRNQGEELDNVLKELNSASTFLAGVSEKISKTDFSAQLQGVEKELASTNRSIRSLEDVLVRQTADVSDKVTLGNGKVVELLEKGFKGAVGVTEESQKISSENFHNVFHQFKLIEQKITASEAASGKSLTMISTAISKVEKEIMQQVENMEEQHNMQFISLNKQINLLRQLLIAGISVGGLLGLAWIGRILM
jgi:hypothetical protein